MATSAVADDRTGVTGGGLPYDNLQPSLAINYIVHTTGTTDELGEVLMFGGNFAPVGWALADGHLLDKAANPDLFGVLGTTYGGDGVTNFALPDLRGRTPIGLGTGAGLTPRPLGSTAGQEFVTLTVDQLPPHTHALPSGATGSTGGGSQHENMQPSLTLNYAIATQGIFPSRDSPATGTATSALGVDEPFLASLGLFTGSALPASFLPADGRLLSIAQNQALFSLLGTTFGGDGRTTFALPDLRGRGPIGSGQGPGLSNQTLGETTGVESGTLTITQMHAHDHTLPSSSATTGSTGGSQPFNNMQPSTALNYIIALNGIFPPRNDAVSPQVAGVEPYLGEVDLFAGNFAPKGWALANGQLFSIAQNQALFSLLGTTYGGDGRTTFALPDFRARIGLGMGQGPGLSDFPEGTSRGTENTTLTVAQMPPHDHSVPEPSSLALVATGLGWLLLRSARRGINILLPRRRASLI